MTLEDFKDENPGSGQLSLYLTGDDNVVGATISKFNCNSVNYSYVLNILRKIIFDDVQLTVSSITSYTNHFYYDIVPQQINIESNFIDSGCVLLEFEPNIDPIPFTYNVYNALIGNATEIRKSSFIYDVDRKNPFVSNQDGLSNQISPANILAILSGSATYAEFQDSNYTDTGLTNARYSGTKTTEAEYGIDPFQSAIAFEGALYQTSTSNNNICSQSIEERTLSELAFNSSDNLYPSAELLPTASFNYSSTDGYIDGNSGVPAELGASETSFIAKMKITRVRTYVPGDLLIISNGQNFDNEFVQIQSLDFIAKSTGGYATYSFTVKKNVDGISQTIVGTSNSSYDLNIIKIHSDTLYTFEGNKVVPVSSKKLYIPLTGQILKTVKGGKVIRVETICSI